MTGGKAGRGGNVLAPWGRIEQLLAKMSDFYDSYSVDISGVDSGYLTDGYLDLSLWKPNERVYQIHNAGSAEATVIYKNGDGDDVTLKLAQNQFSGKLPEIQLIKVSGTSDDLVVFTQKVQED